MSRVIALLVLSTIALVAAVSPASADPLSGLFGALIATGAKVWAVVGSTVIGRAALQIVAGLAASAVSRLFRKDEPPRGVMRRVDFGGDRPMRVLLGEYATAGHLVWSGSHGKAGKTPNAFFTDVILLSVLPIDAVTGVQVNGVRAELGTEVHPDYGLPVLDFRQGSNDYLWIKVYDGTQTAADPMLLTKYALGTGASDDFPWSADMVGDGIAYAIITTRGNNDLFGGQVPSVLFETRGARLYDRRLDSTAGGSGPQRLTDRSTWAFSANPQVALSTVLTAGLAWGDQHLYGPRWPAHIFDAANLFAAMNACDVETEGNEGTLEPMYRFGADLDLSMEPRSFVREMLKCSGADFAICEGQAIVHVGPASAPVAVITDADCSVSHPQDLDPFRGLEELFNAASATFPDPLQAWAMVPAPTARYPDWEAEDGGKRTAAMPFPYVPWVSQVQRLVASSLKDQRRQRIHRLVLSSRYGHLAPLDYIGWTSARNGYDSKLFKVVSVHDHPTGHVELALLEEDPDDFTPPALIEHRPTPPIRMVRAAQIISEFTVSPFILEVGGAARRGGIQAFWDADSADDALGLRIAIRRAGEGGVGDEHPLLPIEAETAVITEGLISGDYEVRARLRVDRPTAWTAWQPVTVPDIRLTEADLSPDLTVPVIVDELPELPSSIRLAFLTTNSKLYRNDGDQWTATVQGVDVDGRGLNILDHLGNTLFGSDGSISPSAYISTPGNIISIAELAANALVPSLNYVGEFPVAPTEVELSTGWRQNAIYKNTTDGYSYILTGSPLAWVQYIADGASFQTVIESSQGTVFRVGQGRSTLLKARLFKNGAEVTDTTPAAWFRWRRMSSIPQDPPHDDASFNVAYQTGYKELSIDVDQVFSRATFFCDIIST